MTAELNETDYCAYMPHLSSMAVSDCLDMAFAGDMHFVVLRSDSTENRRVRAAEVSALKRAIERTYGVALERANTSYSETYGFLSRTECRYRVAQSTVELWEFSNEPGFNVGNRGGVVGVVRCRTFTDRKLIASVKSRAAERQHYVQTRDVK